MVGRVLEVTDTKIITALDAICEQGCEYTNRCIEQLSGKKNCNEARWLALNPGQQLQLLNELQVIMAVYDH